MPSSSDRPTRRSVLKATGSVLAGSALARNVQADEPLSTSEKAQNRKVIGIQVGAVSFVDEGVGQVLDIVHERASVNTIFLAVFSFGRGIAGRQVPGHLLPDHG